MKQIILLISAIFCLFSFQQCSSGNGKAEIGAQAPDFTLTTTEGRTIMLSDYKGKVVIVDFWATWCPPCRRGIPDLVSLQNEYKNDVVVIGISTDQNTRADVPSVMQQMNINYPVVFSTPELVEDFGGIEAIPTTFIIDRSGVIVDKHVGLVPKSVLSEKIQSIK